MKKLALLVLTLAACAPSGPADEAAPALSGPALDGKTVSLADHAGKAVLVDFWATWCDPCREEIPELVKLQDELGPKGFTVLGASMDEDAKEVAPFLKPFKVNYPVILLGGEMAPKGWVVPGLPTAYLVGPDGKIKRRWFGAKSAAEVRAAATAALAK
jgi:thiol-disulfide isomerase/thioredoxin